MVIYSVTSERDTVMCHPRGEHVLCVLESVAGENACECGVALPES